MIVTVDNRVRISKCDLAPELAKELCEVFKHDNPQWHKLRKLGLPLWSQPKYIETWRETDEEFSFPRGGLRRVRDFLDENDVERSISDRRSKGIADKLREIPDHKLELYPYQEDAQEAGIRHQTCILRAPTGSGKTSIGLALIGKLKLHSLVIVPSRVLFDQWLRRVMKELGIPTKKIGVIRGSTVKLAPVTVAMAQSLTQRTKSHPEILSYFGVVLVDEVQTAAATTFMSAIDPFPAYYRIGISADHRRKDGKEFLIQDLFGPIAADIKRADLIESGHIVDTMVRVIPTDFQADWYGVPDDEDESKEELNFNRLLEQMSDDEKRNELVYDAVSRGLYEGSEQDKGPVIVMSHRREHCRTIDRMLVRQGVSTGFLLGGPDQRSEFVQTRSRFEAGRLQVAVGTFQAIGYGIDLPKAGNVVCATPIAGNRYFFNQVRGRICRKSEGKTDSRLWYLWDRRVYGAKHLKNLIKWNKRVEVWTGSEWVDGKRFPLDGAA